MHRYQPRTVRVTLVVLLLTMLAAVQEYCWSSSAVMGLILSTPPDTWNLGRPSVDTSTPASLRQVMIGVGSPEAIQVKVAVEPIRRLRAVGMASTVGWAGGRGQ